SQNNLKLVFHFHHSYWQILLWNPKDPDVTKNCLVDIYYKIFLILEPIHNFYFLSIMNFLIESIIYPPNVILFIILAQKEKEHHISTVFPLTSIALKVFIDS